MLRNIPNMMQIPKTAERNATQTPKTAERNMTSKTCGNGTKNGLEFNFVTANGLETQPI